MEPEQVSIVSQQAYRRRPYFWYAVLVSGLIFFLGNYFLGTYLVGKDLFNPTIRIVGKAILVAVYVVLAFALIALFNFLKKKDLRNGVNSLVLKRPSIVILYFVLPFILIKIVFPVLALFLVGVACFTGGGC